MLAKTSGGRDPATAEYSPQPPDCCQCGRWELPVENLQQPITALPPRVRRNQVVRTIIDHKLAVVLAAVLDGDHPGVGHSQG